MTGCMGQILSRPGNGCHRETEMDDTVYDLVLAARARRVVPPEQYPPAPIRWDRTTSSFHQRIAHRHGRSHVRTMDGGHQVPANGRLGRRQLRR
jgi:hypothetical protein